MDIKALKTYVLSGGADPLFFGVDGYRSVIKMRTVILGLMFPATFTVYKFLGLPYALIALALTILLYVITPSLYRSVLASNLDREIAPLLLYLLPFSWSLKSVADVLAGLSLWKRPPFRWTSKEAGRLELMLNMGKDPLSALIQLAETTPSRRFREVLEVIVESTKTGVSRESTISDLASIAVDQIRSSWRSYVEIAQVAAEASVALMLSIAVIVPIAAMSGNILWALQLPLILSLLFTFILLTYQPTLGLNYSHSSMRYFSVVAVVVATGLLLVNPNLSIAFLATTSLLLEVLWRRSSLGFKEALESFRRATDKARLGLPISEDLQNSRPLLGNVIDAMSEAIKLAGTLGVWKVMDKVYKTVREAVRSALEARSTSYILMAVSAMTPAIAIYIIRSLMAISGEASSALGLGFEYIASEALKWVLLTAPISVMPAAVLHRPRLPSLIPSLLSTLIAIWTSTRLALSPL